MDGQLGKLESDVEYIKRDVAELKAESKALRIELKTEIKEFRAEVKADGQALRSEFKAELKEFRAETKADNKALRIELKADIAETRKTQERDFRLLFGAIIAVALGIATLLAKTLGWIK